MDRCERGLGGVTPSPRGPPQATTELEVVGLVASRENGGRTILGGPTGDLSTAAERESFRVPALDPLAGPVRPVAGEKHRLRIVAQRERVLTGGLDRKMQDQPVVAENLPDPGVLLQRGALERFDL